MSWLVANELGGPRGRHHHYDDQADYLLIKPSFIIIHNLLPPPSLHPSPSSPHPSQASPIMVFTFFNPNQTLFHAILLPSINKRFAQSFFLTTDGQVDPKKTLHSVHKCSDESMEKLAWFMRSLSLWITLKTSNMRDFNKWKSNGASPNIC